MYMKSSIITENNQTKFINLTGIYIVSSFLIATALIGLFISRIYVSKLVEAPILKAIISMLVIAGVYGSILPTQIPQKVGVKPSLKLQSYLEKLVGKKLEFRITPSCDISIVESPYFILWRRQTVYIGIPLLLDTDTAKNHIIQAIEQASVNSLRRELDFWLGIASVTSNNFQIWKPFTKWYINYLKSVNDSNLEKSTKVNNQDFKLHFLSSVQAGNTNIMTSYVKEKGKNDDLLVEASQLDSVCSNLWNTACHFYNETKGLSLTGNLPKYQELCQLVSLDLIDIPLDKLETGLAERTEKITAYSKLCQVNLSEDEYIHIQQVIRDILSDVEIITIAKRELEYFPQIPSFVVVCCSKQSYLDRNEKIILIQKQLQSKINQISGDWTVIVGNKQDSSIKQIVNSIT